MSAGVDLSKHEQDLPRDLQFYDHDGETLVLYFAGHEEPRLYRVIGETTNPRALVSADASVIDGTFVESEYDPDVGLIRTYHPWAGRKDHYTPAEWLPTPALRLARVERRHCS